MATRTDWTSEEIKAQNFRGSVLGYARKEVKEFLHSLAENWGSLLQENARLAARVAVLEKEVNEWHAREKEVQEHRQTVVQEAQKLRENARLEAEHLMNETELKADEIRQRTEQWLEEVIARVEETQRRKQNFLTAFRSALDSHYALIQGEEDVTEPLAAGLTDVLRSQPRA